MHDSSTTHARDWHALNTAGIRPYVLAVVASAAGLAVTRLTWPFFAGTPFLPLFAGIAVATHWGSGRAGLVAVALAVIEAAFAFPASRAFHLAPTSFVTFVAVAVLANRVLASRNQTGAALRASEAELRATWEHAALGSALLNRRGEIERTNPALERLLGYPPTAARGMSFSALSEPDDGAAERQRFADLMNGVTAFYQHEQPYRRRDGTLLWGRITVSAIRGRDGAPTGALAVLEDVTAQRQAKLDLQASEEKLRRAQKMEAIGQLAAGVAHNFNNLLTVTMGYTELLLHRHRGQEPDQSDLEEIIRATERGAALTRQLLAFGRKHDALVARIDLNRTVADLRDMLTRVLREDINLTVGVGSAPATILIDPYDLEQVILNLVLNARDALPIGGSIHVDVGRELVDASRSTPDQPVAPGEYVRLRVRDNGIGMTADVQAHLFEPFFTTKETGQGTGLGLAFVHGVVRHGHGFITVETAPDHGTTVSAYFPPALEGAADPARASASAAAGRGASEALILLVEDEGAVRTMTAGVLSRAGYRVLAAATPGEACAMFDRHADAIDLLLTDIVMPEMHGPALAQRLVAQRPDLRVLFLSGHSDAMPAGTTATGKVAFLAKPFPSTELVSTVAGLLATT